MKKLAITLVCLFGITACQQENASPQGESPSTSEVAAAVASTPARAESYIVGTDANFPPFDFRDEKGQVVGFDVDVLRAIGENQDFDVNFVAGKRADLFNKLNDNTFNILASCLGINPERLEKSDMSEPYVFAPNIIMGKDTGNNPKTLAQLAGKKVAIQSDSFSLDALQKAGVKDLLSDNSSLYLAYKEFLRGDADYVVGDAGALDYHHKVNPDPNKPKVFTAIYAPDEDVRVAFAVKKGDTKLLKKINTGLKNIQANGVYDQIYTKWFGTDNSLRLR